MNVTVWQRHYIKDKAGLEEFNSAVSDTISASQKKDFEYSIFLGYPSKFNGEVQDKMMKEVDRLVEKDVSVVLNRGYGPGTTWFGSMFNYSVLQNASVRNNKEHVNFLIDANQFKINDDKVLDAILLVAHDTIEKDTLLGLGARDKVILSDEPTLDNLRKIEEMYVAKFIGNKIKVKNPLNVDNSDVPFSYKKYGDPIPGFYALNTGTLAYSELFKNIFDSCIFADLTGYAGDPYAVMKASQLVREIPAISVPIKGNPPGRFEKSTIRKKSFELGKTNIGRQYIGVAKDRHFRDELCTMYPKEQVDEVRGMIIEGLEDGLLGFDHKEIKKAT